MANDKPTPKPTKAETAANLLHLGQLLHQFSYPQSDLGLTRPIKPDEAERLRGEIVALEMRVEEAVNDLRQWVLRSVMGVKGREIVDPLVVRIVAYVAWSTLASERPDASVARVSNVVAMNDMAMHLEARRTIRLMVARQTAIHYQESDVSGGGLVLSSRSVKYLSGEGNLAVLWTEQSLKEEKEEWEKRKSEALSRRIPLAGSAETSPQAEASETKPPQFDAQSPKAIFEALRQTVIGIDPVVRKFAVQMAMHLKRVAIMASGKRPTNYPVSCLLIGQSGVGKTFLAEEAGRLLQIPFCIADMTSITASSYVGSSIDDIFLGMAKKGVPPGDISKSLVLMDEIDKKRTNSRGGDFDSVGLGVQYECLRMLENNKIQIGGKRGDAIKGVIDTFGMAFVLSGAFSDIASKLLETTKAPIGFMGKGDSLRTSPDVRELLLDYFIPELVNRIGSVIVIPPPSINQLVQIATAPTGIIARQNQFLASFSLKVIPSPEAIQAIASWALETKTFARGMRSLTQSLVEEAIFEERKGEVTIEAGDVRRAIEGLKTETAGLKNESGG